MRARSTMLGAPKGPLHGQALKGIGMRMAGQVLITVGASRAIGTVPHLATTTPGTLGSRTMQMARTGLGTSGISMAGLIRNGMLTTSKPVGEQQAPEPAPATCLMPQPPRRPHQAPA